MDDAALSLSILSKQRNDAMGLDAQQALRYGPHLAHSVESKSSSLAVSIAASVHRPVSS